MSCYVLKWYFSKLLTCWTTDFRLLFLIAEAPDGQEDDDVGDAESPDLSLLLLLLDRC